MREGRIDKIGNITKIALENAFAQLKEKLL